MIPPRFCIKINKVLKIAILMASIQCLIAPQVHAADEQTRFQDFATQIMRLNALSDNETQTLFLLAEKHLGQTRDALLVNLDSNDTAVRSYAAFFLMDYRFPQAADKLALNITLPNTTHSKLQGREWLQDKYPAMEALVKIGSPCLPAVIRNLAESDDVKTRELSLKVVYRVDGDKDIARLRLQKAVQAEKDPQKQARLQQAVKALEGIAVEKQ